jgi:hypothetical protein
VIDPWKFKKGTHNVRWVSPAHSLSCPATGRRWATPRYATTLEVKISSVSLQAELTERRLI